SREHVQLCDPYCGAAHSKAMKAGGTIDYKCHAGLSCFARPVEISGKRNLAVIGGRAFVKSSDYQQLMERFRTGDLQSIATDEVFANILFSESQRLAELEERVERAARRLQAASSNGSGKVVQPAAAKPAKPEPTKAQQDLEQEVERLRNELAYR